MPDEKRGEEKPEALTPEAIKELVSTTVNAVLNGAVKAQLKKALGGPEFTQAIAAAVAAASKPDEEDQGGGEDDTEPGKKPARAAGGAKISAEVQAQLDAILAANKKLQRDLDAERTARTAAIERQKREEERTMLSTALTEHGVSKDMLRPALALLLHEEKRIRRVKVGEEESVVFADGDEQHSVAEGVKAWVAKDGQRFLPARDAAGTGSPGAARPGAPGKDGQISDVALGQMLAQIG